MLSLRYGPSTNISDKLFKKSKTDVFYYGGQSFAAPTTSSRTSSSSKGEPEMERRLFAPGARESAAKVSRELQERREINAANTVRSRRGVITQEGSEIL